MLRSLNLKKWSTPKNAPLRSSRLQRLQDRVDRAGSPPAMQNQVCQGGSCWPAQVEGHRRIDRALSTPVSRLPLIAAITVSMAARRHSNLQRGRHWHACAGGHPTNLNECGLWRPLRSTNRSRFLLRGNCSDRADSMAQRFGQKAERLLNHGPPLARRVTHHQRDAACDARRMQGAHDNGSVVHIVRVQT